MFFLGINLDFEAGRSRLVKATPTTTIGYDATLVPEVQISDECDQYLKGSLG